MAGSFLHAQSEKELIADADRFFQQGSYPESMQLYSQLLSLHRNDPLYSYRFGVSMLYSDTRDPNAAIRYIESGLGKLKGDDAVLIHFHLGTAYHLTFRFIEAMQYYNAFKEITQNKNISEFNVNQRIDMCLNGVKLLQDVRSLYVFERHQVQTELFFRSYNITKFGGRLLVKPDMFKTKFDKKIENQTIVFLSDTQQVVYYSSYGKDGKSGKDIYRSYKLGSGAWDKPECLSTVVNTPYDEDYPFILPDGNTLYFCSKGHNSMGGYDIFRTTWDEDEMEWTTPVNLDFAINTPYDDILFVTDGEEKYAWFSSARNSGLGKINVYMVRIDVRPEDDQKDLIAEITNLSADIDGASYLNAVQKIQEMSNIDVNADQNEFEDKEAQRRKQLYADNYKYNISQNPTDDELISLTFKYASDADRNLQVLKQKRSAAELSADKYKTLNAEYIAEAEQFYNLAIEETDPVKKKQISEQATQISRYAAEAELRSKQATELVNEFEKTIVLQTAEYDKILLKAGDIQKLASANNIDTSVVLLKRLIDDVKLYETNIQSDIAELLPSMSILEEYDRKIVENQNQIVAINDEMKSLTKERELYVNEVHLTNKPEVRENLQEEIALIDDQMIRLQQQKSELTANNSSLKENKALKEQFFSSPEYQLTSEVLLLDSLLAFHPDQIDSYIQADVQKTDMTEFQSIENVDSVQIAEVKKEGNTSDHVEHNTHSTIVENRDTIGKTDTISPLVINELSDSAEIAMIIPADSINEVVQNMNTENHSQVNDTIVRTNNPEVKIQDNEVVEVEVSDNNKVINETVIQDNAIQLPDLMTIEEKNELLNEIIESDETEANRTIRIMELYEQEKAHIGIRQQIIEQDIAQLVGKIESTERQITELNNQFLSTTLTPYEKNTLQNEVEQLKQTYTNELIELDQLLMMSDMNNEFSHTVEQGIKELSEFAERVYVADEKGSQKKIDAEFEKFVSGIETYNNYVMKDEADVRVTLKKQTDILLTEAERQQQLAEKAEIQAENFNKQSIKASELAAKAKNDKKREFYASDAEQLSLLSQTMNDSADFYVLKAKEIREHASALKQYEEILISEFDDKLAEAVVVSEKGNTLNFTPVSSEKLSRMKSLIAENPYSDGFIQNVVESNQWSALANQSDSEKSSFLPDNTSIINNELLNVVQVTNESELAKSYADRERIVVLRSSATLYVTRIRQLEESISVSTDPENTYRMFTEMNNLQTELNRVISQHNDIVFLYDDLAPIRADNLPYYDRLYNEPQISVASTKRYIELKEKELKALNDQLVTETSVSERYKLRDQIRELENEIYKYQLSAIEIQAQRNRNETIAGMIVLNSIPVSGVNPLLNDELKTLDNQRKEYEQKSMLLYKEADSLTKIEQKQAAYIEAYNNSYRAMETQQKMHDLYKQYAVAGFDPQSEIRRNVYTALNDAEKVNKYLNSGTDEIVSARNVVPDNIVENYEIYNPDTAVVAIRSVETENINSTANNEIVNNEVVNNEVVNNEVVNNEVVNNEVVNNETLGINVTPANESVIITNRNAEEFTAFYSSENPVPEHTAPEGVLLFRVQFAASKRPAADNLYAGMKPLFYEQAEGWYRYMHGEFYQLDVAVEARNKIRTLGYADAFVVAYYSGKRISIAEARNISASQTTVAALNVAGRDEVNVAPGASTESVIQFTDVQGFYYAVQIGVYGSPRNSQRLFGINPLIEERLANGNYRYMTGTYSSLQEANAARDAVRAAGVPDAYVVIYRNGVRINAREAQTYIDAGEKTLSGISERATVNTNRAEETRRLQSENVYFKVQLGAYRNQVPVEVVNAFIAISEDGLSVITDPQGLTIYAAGKFKTLAEAEALKMKVQTGGITDAFIIAVDGDKKIPVQDAKLILGIR